MRRRRTDDGFTLIELLVVVMIIGILAGIAIPVLINQRKKAERASAISDLRNTATAMDAYLADNGAYGNASQLSTAESAVVSHGTTVVIVQRVSSSGFCLAAVRAAAVPGTMSALQNSAIGWYDSQGGGVLPTDATGCPVTTGAQAGWQAEVLVGS